MRRRLGQHFLRRTGVDALLRVVRPQCADTFLEIGPGLGALTVPLAERCSVVRAVELDRRLAAQLRSRAAANVEVIEGDALRVDLRSLVPAGGRIVGNLPYYISGPLLRRVVALHDRTVDAHLMLQEEVAERVASPPGAKSYGILSVLAQTVADVSLTLRLGPEAFDPKPEVRSAVVRLRFKRPAMAIDLEDLGRFLGQAFTHRRKTLANNLKASHPNLKKYLKLCDIEGERRPETLSVVEFLGLYESLRATLTV